MVTYSQVVFPLRSFGLITNSVNHNLHSNLCEKLHYDSKLFPSLQGKSAASPVTKEELGRATWTFLHTLAAQVFSFPLL